MNLTIEGLTVSAGGRTLLRDASLVLRAGEIVVLTGPSGCGKTSFLREVAGLVPDDAGRNTGCRRLGEQTPEELGWPKYRRRVVLVQQTPPMLPGTLRDNLARPFEYASSEGEFPHARAVELLSRLRLREAQLNEEARDLSVGERQRASLVRALLTEPQVLLLDEPTSALDRENAETVEELLRETASRGTGLLMVSHAEGQAERLGARTLDLTRFSPAGAARA